MIRRRGAFQERRAIRGLHAACGLSRTVRSGRGSSGNTHDGLTFDTSTDTSRGSSPGVPAGLREPDYWVMRNVVRWIRNRRSDGPHAASDRSAFVREEPDLEVDLRSAWDAQAPAWIEWSRKPGHDSYWRFGRAAFFELLPAPGRLTLDLGCGEGRLSRDLVAIGHDVVSVDSSKTMVRAAANAAPSIPALVADAVGLPLVDGCCDLVVAYMSLHDIENMQLAVVEAARVLAPGGRFCIALVHPINSAGLFTGAEPQAAFVIKGSYLDAHPYVDRIERDGMEMTYSSRHRPLEDYFRALEHANFLVEAVREVPVDEASVKAAPRRQRWRRLPLFLDLRAVKPNRV